jgi:hypothetical protein
LNYLCTAKIDKPKGSLHAKPTLHHIVGGIPPWSRRIGYGGTVRLNSVEAGRVYL